MAKVSGMENQAMHERSGQIVIPHDPLTGLIYDIVRDHIPPGVFEELLRNNLAKDDTGVVAYCNGWLSQYAQYCAERLTKSNCAV